MSEENTTQGDFLSVEEQLLIAHRRAGNLRGIMELILSGEDLAAEPEAESSAPVEIPTPAPKPRKSEWLDGSERIALMVLGELAKHAILTRTIVAGVNGEEHDLLHWLWFDIAEGIRAGLVAVDEQELIHLHRGVK